MDFAAMFLGGLLGSGHCVGMCGGFVVTIGASTQRFSPALRRQLVYSAGRMFTYGFLGALAGLLGARLIAWDLPLVGAQRTLSIVAGVCMLGIGLTSLGIIRWPRKKEANCSGLNTTLLGHFIRTPMLGGSFLAGVFTGFLPCGLVYGFLALAMGSADPLRGWLGMVIFGAGTVPVLVALGCGSTLLSVVARRRIHQLAACLVLILGGMTIYRGIPREESCCEQAAAPASLALRTPE